MGLLLLHTLGSHAGRYERIAGEIALHGITVEAFDLAGHGDSDGDRGTVASWSTFLDDVEDRLAALRAELLGKPVGIYGHGLGGLITLDYLGTERPSADVAILETPALTAYRPAPRWRQALNRRLGRDQFQLVTKPADIGRASEVIESWQRDSRIVWEFSGSFIRTVQEAHQRAWTNFERIQVPILIDGSQPEHKLPRERPIDPNRVARMYSFARHDEPNDTGWQDQAKARALALLGIARREWPSAVPAVDDRPHIDQAPRAEAVAAFESYVATEPDRLRRFDELVARLGGPALDCDRDSMERFGSWMLDTLEWGEDQTGAPEWFRSQGTGHELSADSWNLIDGLGATFAACLRAEAPELEWRMCTTREHQPGCYQSPVLEPIHLAPPIPASMASYRARDADVERQRTWLAAAWDGWQATLAAARARGFTIEQDDLPLEEIVVDPYEHELYNAQIWIPEGAEFTLGEERFAELPTRLGKLKGIEEIVQEDREVFLIRVADDIDLDGLRRRVVGLVRRMKQSAAGETDAEEQ